MMWQAYTRDFQKQAEKQGFKEPEIKILLDYAEKLYENKYPIIFDLNHLGRYTKIKPEYFYKVLNAPDKFYRYFNIPKKNGQMRRIAEPLPLLKGIQHWILNNILNLVPVHPCAKAFKTNSSIKENAKFHLKQPVVVAVDIEDFFTNISFYKVRQAFMDIGYYKDLATVLANLCCLKSNLPQGAPTSPALSNIVMYGFDQSIYSALKKENLRYTRYADDITVSGDLAPGAIIAFLSVHLKKAGFDLNKKKTRVLQGNQRQLVTGVVVNNKLRVCRTYRKKIRQEMYYIEKFGLESHIMHCNITKSNYIKHLLGKVNHVLNINSKDMEMKKYKKQLLRMIISDNQ